MNVARDGVGVKNLNLKRKKLQRCHPQLNSKTDMLPPPLFHWVEFEPDIHKFNQPNT